MSHYCKALIIHCIDFRLGGAIKNYLARNDLFDNCDVVAVAGAVKNLVAPQQEFDREVLLRQIAISKKLHHITHLILMNHTDCGAYGSPRFAGEAGGRSAFTSRDEEKKKHFEDLKTASAMVKKKYSDLKIQTLLADIEDSEKINIFSV